MMESIVKCRKFEVCRVPVPAQDGATHSYEIIVHPGAVVILPMWSEDTCVLIRNHRRAIGRELWELPAGTLDKPDEPPLDAARRELEEEMGYRADCLSPLCEFYSSPGLMTELLKVYVASGLRPTRQNLEVTEEIRVEKVAFAETLRMIRDGRIVDGKTMAALLRWDMERRAGTTAEHLAPETATGLRIEVGR